MNITERMETLRQAVQLGAGNPLVPATGSQIGGLQGLIGAQFDSDDERYAFLGVLCGRFIASSKELTRGEASVLINFFMDDSEDTWVISAEGEALIQEVLYADHDLNLQRLQPDASPAEENAEIPDVAGAVAPVVWDDMPPVSEEDWAEL